MTFLISELLLIEPRTCSCSKSTLCCHHSQSILFSLRVRSWPVAWLSNPLTQIFLSHFNFHPLVYVPDTLWQWPFFPNLEVVTNLQSCVTTYSFHISFCQNSIYFSAINKHISSNTVLSGLSQVCQVCGVECGNWVRKERMC